MLHSENSKMPISAEITKASNGYIVRSYHGDKRIETVHETIEGAMESMHKIMGAKKMSMHKDEKKEEAPKGMPLRKRYA